uniref:G_PROTEIN_RECEP_F2_4 domain-containing protein n=1 Tax=Panagrellus redivivus TaxID=6233 RepID=A0A7E4W0C2_PANRE
MGWVFALTHVLVAALTVHGIDVLQIVSHRSLPGGLQLNASVIIDNYQSGDAFTAECSYQTTPDLRNGYMVLKSANTVFTCMPVATKVSGWIDTRFSSVLSVPHSVHNIDNYPTSACLDFEISNRNAFIIVQGTNNLVGVPFCQDGAYLHSCNIDGYDVTTKVCIGDMAGAPTTTSTTTTTTATPSGGSTTTVLPGLTTTTTQNPSNPSAPTTTTNTVDNNGTTTSTLAPTTTLPYGIDCNNPIGELEILFCDIHDTDGTPLTPFNISQIVNKTMDSFEPDTLTPQTLYLISKIIQKCSDSKSLTTENSLEIGGLVDKVFGGKTSVFMASESSGHNVGATLYGSVENLMANSPSGASYLHGDNWGFIVHPINCDEDANAGAMGDSGGGFQSGSVGKSDVSVAVDGKAACSRQSNHIYYSIYRTNKMFVGSTYSDTGIISGAFALPSRLDAATSDENVQLPDGCHKGFLTTDGQVLSATAVQRKINNGKDVVIHTAAVENMNMVTLRYKKSKIGVALHGKLKVTHWQPQTQQWSKDTCKVRSDGDYYVSQCTHLTDFTLIVDGSSNDPILCYPSLIAVNYVVVIGSIIALLLLNSFYAMVFFADNEGPVGKRIESFVPRNGKDSYAAVYCIALMTFFLVFCIFSNERTTTGKHGCVAVAIINYWLLMFCITLSIFQSWIITKKFIWSPFLESILIKLTRPAVVYAGSFGFATLLAMGFGFGTKGDFFYRNDRFCWIRADFIVAGVVIPSTILVVNACFSLFTMTIFLFPKFLPKGLRLARGTSRNITRREKIDIKERIAIIILTQFTIGLPWLFQYLTLFLKNASAWHYLFAIVNGAQGIVLLLAFAYRVYRNRKEQNRPWRGSMNNRMLDEKAIRQVARAQRSNAKRPSQIDPEAAEVQSLHPIATKQPTLDAVFEDTQKTSMKLNKKEDADLVSKTQTSPKTGVHRRNRNRNHSDGGSGDESGRASGSETSDDDDLMQSEAHGEQPSKSKASKKSRNDHQSQHKTKGKHNLAKTASETGGDDHDATNGGRVSKSKVSKTSSHVILDENETETESGTASSPDSSNADGNNSIGSDSGLDNAESGSDILVRSKELEPTPLRYLTIIRVTSKSEPDYRLKRKNYSREASEEDVCIVSDVPPELSSETESDSENGYVINLGIDNDNDGHDSRSISSSESSATDEIDKTSMAETGQQEVGRISMDALHRHYGQFEEAYADGIFGEHEVEHQYEVPPPEASSEVEMMAPQSELQYIEMPKYDHVPDVENIQPQYESIPTSENDEKSNSSLSIARGSDGNIDSRPSENTSPSLITSENFNNSSEHSNSLEEESSQHPIAPKKPPRRWDIFEPGESFEVLQKESPVTASILLKFGRATINPDLLSSEKDDLFVKMFASHN